MNRLLQRSNSWLLLPILVLGAVLRLDGLPQRGLIYWDEGKFALEGVRLLSLIQTLPLAHSTALSGKAVGTAKPTHALLIALGYILFGIHDYVPLVLNATASVLQIAVLYALARQLFGGRVALVAATLLTVSGYDIIYARSALSESNANLIFLVGVLLWYSWWELGQGRISLFQNSWFRYVAVGALLGLAFTVNYRLIIYITTLVAIDVLLWWRSNGWRVSGVVSAAWAIGLVLIPITWQVIGAIAHSHGLILFRDEITYRPSSYFGEVLYQLHGGKQSVYHFSPLPYLHWYVVRQGWLASILLLVGFSFAAVDRSFRWLVPAALVLIPYCFYIFAPFIVPRNLDTALPFTALLSAAGLVMLLERVRVHRIKQLGLAGITLLVALSAAIQTWPLTGMQSGFALAAGYLSRHESPKIYAVNEIMRFYLRDPGQGCDALRLPRRLASLSVDGGTEVDYAVIDQYSSQVARYLAGHARIVARFPSFGPATLQEDLVASENGLLPRSHVGHVDIYALENLQLRVRGSTSPEACILDYLA